jgi:prolipoprotein diacylglyceryltransferase
VEFVRHHDQGLISGLSLTQWISLATFLAGIVLLLKAPARQPAATHA